MFHPPIRRFLLGALFLILAGGLACSGDNPAAPGSGFDAEHPWNGYRVAFTFSSDDNNIDNLTWAEVFRRHGVRFTIFTVSTWVGGAHKLDTADVRGLDSLGFEIGGHSRTHPHMVALDDSTLDAELEGCRSDLEAIVGRPGYRCEVFAYPYHEHDVRVMEHTSRYYLAARDGGLSSQGRPLFSEGGWTWDDFSLYETPLPVTMNRVVQANALTEEETRNGVRELLKTWKEKRAWVNIYAHNLQDCDEEHMRWLIEELIEDGDVWVAPFGTVAKYCRQATGHPWSPGHEVVDSGTPAAPVPQAATLPIRPGGPADPSPKGTHLTLSIRRP